MITSSRAQPQVRVLLGLRRISAAVMVEATNTDMSVSICPASTSRARDPVSTADITSIRKTEPVTASVAMRRRW